MSKIKIKELLRNKKVMAGAALALILAMTITAVLLYRLGGQQLPVAESSPPASSDPIPSVPTPIIPTETAATTDSTTTTIPGVIDVGGDPEQTGTTESRVSAQEPEKPVNPVTPPTESGGIDIGGEVQQPEKYDCKTPKHHCQDAEAHAWIQNLEIQGCQICGAHDCPSIYAVDEWGGACPDLKKCPHYDEKKNPVEYCQACGRKNGDGDNGTCQKWIVDFTCPKCGQNVPANECHSHE